MAYECTTCGRISEASHLPCAACGSRTLLPLAAPARPVLAGRHASPRRLPVPTLRPARAMRPRPVEAPLSPPSPAPRLAPPGWLRGADRGGYERESSPRDRIGAWWTTTLPRLRRRVEEAWEGLLPRASSALRDLSARARKSWRRLATRVRPSLQTLMRKASASVQEIVTRTRGLVGKARKGPASPPCGGRRSSSPTRPSFRKWRR